MKLDQVESLDWSKGDGLLPAVVQDARTGKVLMLGYMNREALRATLGASLDVREQRGVRCTAAGPRNST